MSEIADTLARMDANQLDAVIGAVPEPAVALDRHLRVVALNPAARTPGSTFTVYLPLANATYRSISEPDRLQPVRHGARR